MSVVITAANLRTIARGARDSIVDGIVANQALLVKYGINTGPNAVRRVSHFLGQSASETQGFTRLEENLYYTTTRRLMQVWPSRFRSSAAAAPYVRNPEKLADLVYASRLGNGPPSSGDGWRYRGSGCKQTTGRYNFNQVEKATKLPVVAKPELLRSFPVALEAACVYWRDNNLVRFADRDDVTGLTRAIQGGTGGLADRRTYTARAKAVKWQEARSGSAATGTRDDASGPVPDAPEPIVTVVDDSKRPTLRNGDGVTRNTALRPIVEHAQRRLAVHGFEPGVIDGKFGDGTERAVVDLQKAFGLMPDGVIGPATWPVLDVPPKAPGKTDRSDPAPAQSGGGKGAAITAGTVAAGGAVAAVAADNDQFAGILLAGGVVVAIAVVAFLVIRNRKKKGR